MHCAKPNHRYTECRSATQEDKNAISKLLQEKKFYFKKLNERSENLRKNKFYNSKDLHLNQQNPSQ